TQDSFIRSASWRSWQLRVGVFSASSQGPLPNLTRILKNWSDEHFPEFDADLDRKQLADPEAEYGICPLLSFRQNIGQLLIKPNSQVLVLLDHFESVAV